MNLHESVADGSFGSFEDVEQALKNGADVNIRGRNGQTPLMKATAARDLEKMELLVDSGADPELSDDFNDTALRHAVHSDFYEGVKYLLGLGVDRGYQPKYPLKEISYDFEMRDTPPIPDELKQVMSEQEWIDATKEQWASLIELGRNPTVEPMISDVQSVKVLELFLDAGDDLKLAPSEVIRTYVGLGNEGDFEASAKDYREHRSPRFGTRNPEMMNNPFWRDMIRLGGSAYAARSHFDETDLFGNAVWCFDRFGASLTPLGDGRFVQIGGEHEDFYDPDFYIYNDVVIHDGQGDFTILGYPREVFPPTDFHTATLAGDSIYIVGCLGYGDQRETGRTPVYRLVVDEWKIAAVTTSGAIPSWLHDHHATYDDQRNVILVEGGNRLVAGQQDEMQIVPNDERYELNLESFTWEKLK